MTHICVCELTIIGSDNGLSSGRRQAIIRTNAGILLIGPLRTNTNETSIKIHTFSFNKIYLKLSSVKWRPFCPSLNVLIVFWAKPSTHSWGYHINAFAITVGIDFWYKSHLLFMNVTHLMYIRLLTKTGVASTVCILCFGYMWFSALIQRENEWQKVVSKTHIHIWLMQWARPNGNVEFERKLRWNCSLLILSSLPAKPFASLH